MVLQQQQNNPIWGKADPGEFITIAIGGQKQTTTTDVNGDWRVSLQPLPVGGPYQLSIRGNTTIIINDVLVGEVWVCSGQSNMEWPLIRTNNAAIELLSANYPNIRVISPPHVGTQEAQWDVEAQWETLTPESARYFSAIGYYYGRILHQTLNVPIGLINLTWGGSPAEAWIDRKRLQTDHTFDELMEYWTNLEVDFDYEKVLAEYQTAHSTWEKASAEAISNGDAAPKEPRKPNNELTFRRRPANIYNGMLKPIIGYGIKGNIWYQGESNTSEPEQYAVLFPLLINSWRKEWNQGDFPFYWVQLADYYKDTEEPTDADWAWLREAQTQTLSLPNTGQVVITDLGESRDIHPRNKREVATRLARVALAQTYGYDLPSRNPQFASMQINSNRATLTFDYVDSPLYAFDVTTISGFIIAGEDRVFHHANAQIINDNTVEVWSDQVENPVAVRYNWAHDPIGNLITREQPLILTPFRTDDWPRRRKQKN